MFDHSQDKQTCPKNSGYQGNSYRSLERLIQGLCRLPNYWRLVPCLNKKPLGKKWQSNYYSPQVLWHSLIHKGRVWVNGKQGLYPAVPNGYSLLCGHQVGDRYLVAIDCDSHEALNQLEQMKFPPTVSYSSGRSGRRQYLYYVDQAIESFKSSNGLEVRGKNLLSTLPPSVHPLTGNYYWLNAPDELQIATISNLWLNQLRPKPKSTLPKFETKKFSSKTVEELVYAISPIYADIYHDWIRVGMALKDWDERLLWLWDDWSRSSHKYHTGECRYRWSTFNGSGITFRTVYYYAKIS